MRDALWWHRIAQSSSTGAEEFTPSGGRYLYLQHASRQDKAPVLREKRPSNGRLEGTILPTNTTALLGVALLRPGQGALTGGRASRGGAQTKETPRNQERVLWISTLFWLLLYPPKVTRTGHDKVEQRCCCLDANCTEYKVLIACRLLRNLSPVHNGPSLSAHSFFPPTPPLWRSLVDPRRPQPLRNVSLSRDVLRPAGLSAKDSRPQPPIFTRVEPQLLVSPCRYFMKGRDARSQLTRDSSRDWSPIAGLERARPLRRRHRSVSQIPIAVVGLYTDYNTRCQNKFSPSPLS